MDVPDVSGVTSSLSDACYEHFPLPVPSQGEAALYNQFSMEEALHRNLAGKTLRTNRSGVVLLDSPWRPWITCCRKTWNMCGSRSQITNPGGSNYWRDKMAAFCSGEWCPTMIVVMGVTFFQLATFKPVVLLLQMPLHFRRNVMIFAYEDSPGSLRTFPENASSPFAHLHDVMQGLQTDKPVLISAPHTTIAVEHIFDPERERQFSVLATWTMQGKGAVKMATSARAKALRSALQKEMLKRKAWQDPKLETLNPRPSLRLPTPGYSPINGTSSLENAMYCSPASGKCLYDYVKESDFCLEPPGDTPCRTHFYHAVLAGCIPVIFDGDVVTNLGRAAAGWTRWAWRADGRGKTRWRDDSGLPDIDFTEFSVVFDIQSATARPATVIDALLAIPQAMRREMRRALMRVHNVYGYANDLTRTDASSIAAHLIELRLEATKRIASKDLR